MGLLLVWNLGTVLNIPYLYFTTPLVFVKSRAVTRLNPMPEHRQDTPLAPQFNPPPRTGTSAPRARQHVQRRFANYFLFRAALSVF